MTSPTLTEGRAWSMDHSLHGGTLRPLTHQPTPDWNSHSSLSGTTTLMSRLAKRRSSITRAALYSQTIYGLMSCSDISSTLTRYTPDTTLSAPTIALAKQSATSTSVSPMEVTILKPLKPSGRMETGVSHSHVLNGPFSLPTHIAVTNLTSMRSTSSGSSLES